MKIGDVITGIDGTKRKIFDDRWSLAHGRRMIFYDTVPSNSADFDVEFKLATPEAFAEWMGMPQQQTSRWMTGCWYQNYPG